VRSAAEPVESPAGSVARAAPADAPSPRPAVDAGGVEIPTASPWVPRWRRRLLLIALGLLAAAVAIELWWFRSHPA
jgi:hypothetical protein